MNPAKISHVIAREMYIFVQVLFNTQQSKRIYREEEQGNNKCSEMKPTNSTETSSKLFKDKLVLEVYKNRGEKKTQLERRTTVKGVIKQRERQREKDCR